MSERLFIRLGSAFEKPCHWMIWSEQESVVVDSGELQNASELAKVSENLQIQGVPVDVFVSSAALLITQVELPLKGRKQALKSIPFMLEESLVDNIENLHIVLGPREEKMADVVVVSHEQMQLWMSWLKDADLKPRQIVPDCLALPMVKDTNWSSMMFGDECLFRMTEGIGMSIPAPWMDVVIPRLLEESEPPVSIATHSEMDLSNAEIVPQTFELPLLVLSRGLALAPVDLLTGAYKCKREVSKNLLIWRKAAIAAGICIILSLINKGINIYTMNTEIAQLKKESADIFHKAVPGSKRVVNLRSQLGSELNKLQNKGSGQELFVMLKNLKPAFNQVPDLKPTALRFEGNRNELRMQVSADSYSQIEKFTEIAKQNFKLETGSMNSSDDLVTSTLVIRNL